MPLRIPIYFSAFLLSTKCKKMKALNPNKISFIVEHLSCTSSYSSIRHYYEAIEIQLLIETKSISTLKIFENELIISTICSSLST